jgi:putative FmdB family regulatory protein
MPIYEYRCAKCGFQDEYLQKVSEAPLTVCPSCGKAKFEKLLSAAGFQLKGSGWYATDFKGGSKTAAAKADAKGEAKSEATPESKGEAKAVPKSEAKAEPKSEAKSETKAKATPASTVN